jgi:hypothetical protein
VTIIGSARWSCEATDAAASQLAVIAHEAGIATSAVIAHETHRHETHRHVARHRRSPMARKTRPRLSF